MKRSLKLICLYLIPLLTSFSLFSAPNDTADYWKCGNRAGGSWSFGRAPSICDFDDFLPLDFAKKTYTSQIFDDRVSVTNERERYMGEMYSALKYLATWYIKQRNPKVLQDEVDGFVRAVFSMAHQESYWSHYRISSSGRLQMMRGDYGHGHGLFQVDDRWHFNAVVEGKAANMIMNGVYSLDEYYAAWLKSSSVWCIKSSSDYYNRARAAYSAYNGGPSKICRWTNPADTWARNDNGFKQKLDAQSWRNYIKSEDEQTSLNIPCIAAGGESCSPVDDPIVSPQLIGIYPVSTFIKLNKSINLRTTPGGVKIGVLAQGDTFQVLGVFLSDDPKAPRYYQVMKGQLIGYLFAGDNQSYDDWVVTTNKGEADELIFSAGKQIEVIAYEGIPYWQGDTLATSSIEWGELLTIESVEITKNFSLFYHVNWKGLKIRIDGGKLGETILLSKDIAPYDDQGTLQWARLTDQIFYMNVRSLKSTSSKINGVLSGPKVKLQYFKLLSSDGVWCQVKMAEISGYVKCHYVEKVER